MESDTNQANQNWQVVRQMHLYLLAVFAIVSMAFLSLLERHSAKDEFDAIHSIVHNWDTNFIVKRVWTVVTNRPWERIIEPGLIGTSRLPERSTIIRLYLEDAPAIISYVNSTSTIHITNLVILKPTNLRSFSSVWDHLSKALSIRYIRSIDGITYLGFRGNSSTEDDDINENGEPDGAIVFEVESCTNCTIYQVPGVLTTTVNKVRSGSQSPYCILFDRDQIQYDQAIRSVADKKGPTFERYPLPDEDRDDTIARLKREWVPRFFTVYCSVYETNTKALRKYLPQVDGSRFDSEFKYAFPILASLTNDFDATIEDIKIIAEKYDRRDAKSISIFDINIPVGKITSLGPLLLIVMQFYLIAYLLETERTSGTSQKTCILQYRSFPGFLAAVVSTCGPAVFMMFVVLKLSWVSLVSWEVALCIVCFLQTVGIVAMSYCPSRMKASMRWRVGIVSSTIIKWMSGKWFR